MHFWRKIDAPFYVQILERYLLPFIHSNFSASHRFMQDNDPKHTSRVAKEFFDQNNINWWRTPPESPDCNPIENLWQELKEYIRREAKPKSKQELIDGIMQFWQTVDTEKCCWYIGQLDKVFTEGYWSVQGEATGYWDIYISSKLCLFFLVFYMYT